MHFACGGWLKVAINLSMYFLHRQICEVMAVEITWGGNNAFAARSDRLLRGRQKTPNSVVLCP